MNGIRICSGRWAFVAFTIWAATSSCASADPIQSDCRLKRVLQLPLTYNKDGLPLIAASVAGHDVTVLLDTETNGSALSESTVKALRLEALPDGGLFYFGRLYPKSRLHQDFALGHLRTPKALLYEVPAAVLPDGADGSMGMDFLQSLDLELDFGANTLSLFLPEHCPTTNIIYWTAQPYARVPFDWEPHGFITLPVTLDGKRIDAGLDTSAPVSEVTSVAAEVRLDIEPDNPRETPAPDVGRAGTQPKRYPFKTLAFGEVIVGNPAIDILPMSASMIGRMKVPGYALGIGMNVLRHLHIYIARKERALYITPADAH